MSGTLFPQINISDQPVYVQYRQFFRGLPESLQNRIYAMISVWNNQSTADDFFWARRHVFQSQSQFSEAVDRIEAILLPPRDITPVSQQVQRLILTLPEEIRNDVMNCIPTGNTTIFDDQEVFIQALRQIINTRFSESERARLYQRVQMLQSVHDREAATDTNWVENRLFDNLTLLVEVFHRLISEGARPIPTRAWELFQSLPTRFREDVVARMDDNRNMDSFTEAVRHTFLSTTLPPSFRERVYTVLWQHMGQHQGLGEDHAFDHIENFLQAMNHVIREEMGALVAEFSRQNNNIEELLNRLATEHNRDVQERTRRENADAGAYISETIREHLAKLPKEERNQWQEKIEFYAEEVMDAIPRWAIQRAIENPDLPLPHFLASKREEIGKLRDQWTGLGEEDRSRQVGEIVYHLKRNDLSSSLQQGIAAYLG
ncbi:MAG: hypothetical protein JSS61_02790 [Verrucomicrobia bacterium]|nr:hypothetical protein [Verrucomicrobiota bacterium]